jgi:hypothetical protein
MCARLVAWPDKLFYQEVHVGQVVPHPSTHIWLRGVALVCAHRFARTQKVSEAFGGKFDRHQLRDRWHGQTSLRGVRKVGRWEADEDARLMKVGKPWVADLTCWLNFVCRVLNKCCTGHYESACCYTCRVLILLPITTCWA